MTTHPRTPTRHNTQATFEPLPKELVHLVTAARYGKLDYIVEGSYMPLGDRVVDCAARYATGRNRVYRLRELWGLYGQWYETGMK